MKFSHTYKQKVLNVELKKQLHGHMRVHPIQDRNRMCRKSLVAEDGYERILRTFTNYKLSEGRRHIHVYHERQELIIVTSEILFSEGIDQIFVPSNMEQSFLLENAL